jgi:hypothetical protein
MGFVSGTDSWSLTEGEKTTRKLAVNLNGTLASDWTVNTTNAPIWLGHTSTPVGSNVELDANVPYDAAALPITNLKVELRRKLDGCVSSLDLAVSVKNKLRVVDIGAIGTATAAAFNQKRAVFYVLTSAQKLYALDPDAPAAPAELTGLPSGLVLSAIATAADSLFLVAGNQLKIIDLNGGASQDGYTFAKSAGLRLAAVGGRLFSAAPGATAEHLSGNFTTASPAPVSDVADLATDGSSVITLQSGGTHAMHRLLPPTFAIPGAACLADSSSTQVAIFGATSAWVENSPPRLRFGLHATGCSSGPTITLASSGSTAWAVGMLSENRALAFSALGGGSFSAAIYDRSLSSPFVYGDPLVGQSGSGIGSNPRLAMSPRYALVHAYPGSSGTPFLIQL